MRDNIVKAIVKEGTRINTDIVYQYDYGLKLVVEGIELPEFYEVHFINKNDNTAHVVHGQPDGVEIPDMFLQTGQDIVAWLYVHTDSDDGETAYEIRIPVVPRPNITDAPIPQPEQREIDQVMSELRRGVGITTQNVATTETNVQKTATNVLHYPFINQLNKHWMVWDANEGDFVDTGVEAIGERGKLENMRIGVVETLPAGAQATASVEVGDDEIILNLGLPSGDALAGFALFEEKENLPIVMFSYGADNVATSNLIIGIDPIIAGTGEPGPRNIRRISTWDALTLTHNTTEHVFTFGIPGGVASGTFDPLNGKLVIDRVLITKRCVDMDNGEFQPGWKNSGIRELVGEGISEVFTGQTLNIGRSYGVDTTDDNDVLYLGYEQYGMRQSEWVATEINVQVCVELAEPIEYDLQGIMLPTVFGANTIHADTGNILYIKYPCDTKLYIDNRIAALQALILEHE